MNKTLAASKRATCVREPVRLCVEIERVYWGAICAANTWENTSRHERLSLSLSFVLLALRPARNVSLRRVRTAQRRSNYWRFDWHHRAASAVHIKGTKPPHSMLMMIIIMDGRWFYAVYKRHRERTFFLRSVRDAQRSLIFGYWIYKERRRVQKTTITTSDPEKAIPITNSSCVEAAVKKKLR